MALCHLPRKSEDEKMKNQIDSTRKKMENTLTNRCHRWQHCHRSDVRMAQVFAISSAEERENERCEKKKIDTRSSV